MNNNVMLPEKVWVLVIMFVILYGQTHTRICGNIDVRHSLVNLEEQLRGCTIVVGNLKILLIEYYYNTLNDTDNIQNATFPELTEITGYLLFFRVEQITSVGRLFPNLAVIRGQDSIEDFSLIIYYAPQLEEIGLRSLRYIQNGSTHIQKCPKLCFADTINWTQIGGPFHKLRYLNANPGDCEDCALHCNGFCWSRNHCQKTDTSEPLLECLESNNGTQCDACRSTYLENGKCVPDCPTNKLRNAITYSCMSEEECSGITKGHWWSFQGQCIRKCPKYYSRNVSIENGGCEYCGDTCKKICRGGYLDTFQSAKYFRDCTHINGYLVIEASVELTHLLGETLENVQEIDDYLVVHRSHSVTSLNFLKNLKLVRGKSLKYAQYSLLVYQNDELNKLWDWNDFTLNIERGKMYFHYNPLLCMSEINTLISTVGAESVNYTSIDVSPYSNGDKIMCSLINMSISISNVTATSVKINWQENDMFSAYFLYYAEDAFKTITVLDERYECSDSRWTSQHAKNGACIINNLVPFTQYAIYMQIFTESVSSAGQTSIYHFRTLSSAPTEPTDINVALTTSNSILLKWNSPLHRGDVSIYYKIDFYIVEEEQYDGCLNTNGIPILQDIDVNENVLELWIKNTTCCEKQHWEQWGRFKRSSPIATETIIVVNRTKYEVRNLSHFRIYVLMLAACNTIDCSGSLMIYQRTQPKEGADDIPSAVTVFVNTTKVFVNWLEPTNPNCFILSYLVEYTRTDLNDMIAVVECVLPNTYASGNSGYIINNLLPGKYSLRIKAVSLAGPGRPTEHIEFEIEKVQSYNESYYPITIPIFVLIVIGLGCFYVILIKKQKLTLFKNAQYQIFLSKLNKYEILHEDIEINQTVNTDNGNFGVICNGFIKLQNRPCTIKVAKTDINRGEMDSLLKDAAMMEICKSYHVVEMLGILSKSGPVLVVMELMSWGDLKSYLKQAKDETNKMTHGEIYRMAAEIADGMMYLISQNVIHRDLAARNCFVAAGRTVKIVSFGITKDIYKEDYWKKGNGDIIPVRWMAPESLADGVFTQQSNVWTYGVVLWEIITFAQQPYANLSDENVERHVIGQKVLENPDDCPDLLYDIMIACWRWKSQQRPMFSDLLKQLQNHLRRDFKLVSFFHSREGRRYRKTKHKHLDFYSKESVSWKKDSSEVRFCLPVKLPQYQNLNLPSTSGLSV